MLRVSCLIVSLLAACGEGETRVAVPLELVRVGAAPGPERLLRRITPPTSTSEWLLQVPVVELLHVGNEDALHMQGGPTSPSLRSDRQRHELRVPGSYDASQVNLVRVEVVARHTLHLRVGFSSPGQTEESPGRESPARDLVGSADVGFVRAGERRKLTFDLRNVAALGGEFTQLALVANGETLDWSLIAIELFHRPLARWLPGPGDSPELIDLGGEARRGIGLASQRPLEVRLQVREGECVDFSYAAAPNMPPTPGARLRVVVQPSKGAEHTLADLPLEDGSAWHHARLDLAPWAGSSIHLRFELQVPDGRTALMVLADPVLVTPETLPATVLFITSDTHRADHLGVARAGVGVRTPVLDALAARGVLFDDCFSPSNLTLPSHVAMMTGINPRDTGVTDNETRLAERADTLAERYRAAGFATYAVTSAKHMEPGWSGLGQGFDRMSWPTPDRERSAAESIDILDDWMEDATGRPLFVWLHLFDAHRPYAPSEEEARIYYGAERDPFDPALPPLETPLPPGLPDLKDLAWVSALYKGEVSTLDRELERVLTRPRFLDGVVAVTGDHGESFGEHGLWWGHVGVYPSVLHVPLILSWPGGPRGLRLGRGVRNYDVSRTLLSLSGLDSGDDFPGEDLSRLVADGSEPSVPRFALGSEGHALALTQGVWHLVVNLAQPKGHERLITRDNPGEHAVELFDLSLDPGCERDRAEDEPERTGRMCRALLLWIENPAGSLASENELTPARAALLGELGYATSDVGGSSGLVDLELLRRRLAPFLGQTR